MTDRELVQAGEPDLRRSQVLSELDKLSPAKRDFMARARQGHRWGTRDRKGPRRSMIDDLVRAGLLVEAPDRPDGYDLVPTPLGAAVAEELPRPAAPPRPATLETPAGVQFDSEHPLAKWLTKLVRDGGYGYVRRQWRPKTIGELLSVLDEVLLIDGVDGNTKSSIRLGRIDLIERVAGAKHPGGFDLVFVDSSENG